MLTALPLLLASALAGPAATDGDWEAPERIRAAAKAALDARARPGQRVEVEVTLDERLRLPACARDLSARVQNDTSVETSCDDAAGWRIYVPVRVRRFATLAVLTRNLAPGERIDANAIAWEERELTPQTAQGIAAPATVEGLAATRMLMSGTVLTASVIKAPAAIRRGDTVTLTATAGGLSVRAVGQALGDGAAGDRIAVKNLSSQRIVQGVVVEAGRVDVIL